MTKSLTSGAVDFLKEQQVFSIGVLRLVGYGLIAMALIDYISLLIPLKLMNPVWEFQTIGSIIERIPIILLGIAFVFWGERENRTPIETILLKWLSWFSLVLAIFLLISFPLNIINGFRIYYSNNARVNTQVSDRVEALSQFQTKLESAESVEQISLILQQQTNSRISIPESIDRNKLKKDVLKNLAKNQNQLKSQAASLQATKAKTLLKHGIKWNLGALIAAFILFFIWQHTFWARIKYQSEIE